MRIFDRANDSVGDTKVDTNKTPFEYTYISQHFGFIIPSSFEQDRRRRKRGKNEEKADPPFVEQFCQLQSTERTITDELARERERERGKKRGETCLIDATECYSEETNVWPFYDVLPKSRRAGGSFE